LSNGSQFVTKII